MVADRRGFLLLLRERLHAGRERIDRDARRVVDLLGDRHERRLPLGAAPEVVRPRGELLDARPVTQRGRRSALGDGGVDLALHALQGSIFRGGQLLGEERVRAPQVDVAIDGIGVGGVDEEPHEVDGGRGGGCFLRHEESPLRYGSIRGLTSRARGYVMRSIPLRCTESNATVRPRYQGYRGTARHMRGRDSFSFVRTGWTVFAMMRIMMSLPMDMSSGTRHQRESNTIPPCSRFSHAQKSEPPLPSRGDRPGYAAPVGTGSGC